MQILLCTQGIAAAILGLLNTIEKIKMSSSDSDGIPMGKLIPKKLKKKIMSAQNMAKFLKNQVLKIVMMVAAMIKLMKELVHLKLMKELVHLSIHLEKRMDWFLQTQISMLLAKILDLRNKQNLMLKTTITK